MAKTRVTIYIAYTAKHMLTI